MIWASPSTLHTDPLKISISAALMATTGDFCVQDFELAAAVAGSIPTNQWKQFRQQWQQLAVWKHLYCSDLD